MQKILITGGTGFIGKALIDDLVNKKYQITVLTRNNQLTNTSNIFYVNSLENLEFNFDLVINLAGEPIATYWNKKNQDQIISSRIEITKKIVEKINQSLTPPQAFITGSAIGIYGINSLNNLEQESDEKTTINQKTEIFSQKLCYDWEQTALKAVSKTRVVLLRTGIVLGKNGGILKKMLLPFFFGVGGKISHGQQIMSWIAIEDVVGIINLAINNKNIEGPINLTAPRPVSNKTFSQALAKSLNRPCLFTIPSFFLKKIYGQMAEELMLNGQKIIPAKALENNYQFKFIDIEDCLKNIFKTN